MKLFQHITRILIVFLLFAFAVGYEQTTAQSVGQTACSGSLLLADVFPGKEHHKVQFKFKDRGFSYIQVFDGSNWQRVEPSPIPIPISSLAVRVLADVSPHAADTKDGYSYLSRYLECAFDAVFDTDPGFLNLSERATDKSNPDLIGVGLAEKGCFEPFPRLAGVKECFVKHVEHQLQNANEFDYAILDNYTPPSEFSPVQIVFRWRERVLNEGEIEKLRDKSVIVFDFAEVPRPQNSLSGVGFFELPAPSKMEMVTWPHSCKRFHNEITSKINEKNYLRTLRMRVAEFRTTQLLEIESKLLTTARDIESPNSSPIIGRESRFRLWFKNDASSEEYCRYANTKMIPSKDTATPKNSVLMTAIKIALPISACGLGPAFAAFLYVIGVLTLKNQRLKKYIEDYTVSRK